MGKILERTIAGSCYRESKSLADAAHCELMQEVEGLNIPMRDSFGIRLALEEVLINAVKHGNFEMPSMSSDAFLVEIEKRNVSPYIDRIVTLEATLEEIIPGTADRVLCQDFEDHILRQADPNKPEDTLELRKKKREKREKADTVLTIVVRDQGKGFDIDKVPDCRSDDGLERESGRGVLLTYAFLDAVQFLNSPTGLEVRCQVAYVRAKALAATNA